MASNGPGPALLHYAQEELAAAVDALDAFGGRLHAGVHRARKAMRRTRATLAMGRTTLGPGARVVDRALRRVNRSLSQLRDAHALVETLDRLADKQQDAATQQILQRARRAAAARRSELENDAQCLQSVVDARSVLSALRAALSGLPWAALTPDELDVGLAHTTHRIVKALARVVDTDTEVAWHAWRRRVRRLSQQHRARNAAGLAGELTEFDKSLAEKMGDLQDLQLLLDACNADSPFDKDDRDALDTFAKEQLHKQRRRLLSVATHRVATASHSTRPPAPQRPVRT
ncbi:CHAD domain-containing protein [Lysobacter sp. KIS68-7]|uniref:CHAD domain-containing protein n=1 Tax=Lysobacter sp. KIS68-7 TaxID=2904252 RepID=UPI001E4F74C2|nr:CHAD domain-containing protein [Lysobacter sp. KIS68-7]UHQ19307.1 CHAD domain-containing protein [Lysobacter sp. KIS68-7]